MIPTLNPLTPGTPHVNHKEAATGVLFSVPDRGRNSGAVTSRLLEPRHMPGVSPAHSVPHAGSRQRSPAHSEVRRQSRVLSGCLCCILTHTSCRVPREDNVAALGADPSCSFSGSWKSSSSIVTLALHIKQTKVMKTFNVSWQDLEQGTEMDLHLSQGLLLPRSNKIACFGKLRNHVHTL